MRLTSDKDGRVDWGEGWAGKNKQFNFGRNDIH
jgi:hypothetical protein